MTLHPICGIYYYYHYVATFLCEHSCFVPHMWENNHLTYIHESCDKPFSISVSLSLEHILPYPYTIPQSVRQIHYQASTNTISIVGIRRDNRARSIISFFLFPSSFLSSVTLRSLTLVVLLVLVWKCGLDENEGSKSSGYYRPACIWVSHWRTKFQSTSFENWWRGNYAAVRGCGTIHESLCI